MFFAIHESDINEFKNRISNLEKEKESLQSDVNKSQQISQELSKVKIDKRVVHPHDQI